MSDLHPRKISLTDEAKESFDALCRRFGMTQISAIARVVDWLQRQPEEIQALALGQIPDSIAGDIIDLMHQRQSDLRREAQDAEDLLLEADEAVRQKETARKSRKNVARAR